MPMDRTAVAPLCPVCGTQLVFGHKSVVGASMKNRTLECVDCGIAITKRVGTCNTHFEMAKILFGAIDRASVLAKAPQELGHAPGPSDDYRKQSDHH